MKTKLAALALDQNIGRTPNNHSDHRQFALSLGRLMLIAVCALSPAAPAQAGDAPRAPYLRVISGQGTASQTLEWDGGADHQYAELWVKVDGEDEKMIVEQGKGTRRVAVEPGKTYLYILSDANERLATVTVKAGQVTAIPPSKPAATSGISAWVGRWDSARTPGGQFEIIFQLSGGDRLKGTIRDVKNPQITGKLVGTLFGNVLTYRGEQTDAIRFDGTFVITGTTAMTIDGNGVSRTVVGEKKFRWTGWKMQ